MSEGERLYNLGWDHAEGGDISGAIRLWRAAVDLGDGEWSPRCQYQIGATYFDTGPVDQAQNELLKAVEYNHPRWSMKACIFLGQLCIAAARRDLARQWWEKVQDHGDAEDAATARRCLLDCLDL